jgi:DNA-binding MarR family transcriptional regulator
VGPPLIGALLRMPWEAVRQRMLERLHERGFADLDMPHLNVLQYPGPDGVRPSELAARLRVSKQALNYLLGQLEDRGYVERVVDEQDGRSRRISLTARGHDALRTIRAAVAEVEAEWSERLGRRRFAQLRALLVELSDAAP